MGYTHYWKIDGEVPSQAIKDIQSVVNEYERIIHADDIQSKFNYIFKLNPIIHDGGYYSFELI